MTIAHLGSLNTNDLISIYSRLINREELDDICDDDVEVYFRIGTPNNFGFPILEAVRIDNDSVVVSWTIIVKFNG